MQTGRDKKSHCTAGQGIVHTVSLNMRFDNRQMHLRPSTHGPYLYQSMGGPAYSNPQAIDSQALIMPKPAPEYYGNYTTGGTDAERFRDEPEDLQLVWADHSAMAWHNVLRKGDWNNFALQISRTKGRNGCLESVQIAWCATKYI